MKFSGKPKNLVKIWIWSRFRPAYFFRVNFCRKRTISLFVYYNCSVHLVDFFRNTCFLSRTVEKIRNLHLKRLEIVCYLTTFFISKSTCIDKVRPRAGQVSVGPKNVLPWKSRHDSKGVEKKVYSKILSLGTKNWTEKVGLQLFLQ